MTLLSLNSTFLIDAERTDAQLDEAIDDTDDVAVAAITVAELRVGVRLAGLGDVEHNVNVSSMTCAM